VIEEFFFNDVLRAAGRKGMILLVFDLFPQKGHGR